MAMMSKEQALTKNNITLAKMFNFTTQYIDDVLTLNNSRFATVIRHIYPSELDLKRTDREFYFAFLLRCIDYY